MNVKPVFTKVFIASLRKLNTAAKNPLSNSSKIIFREFVADFGPYYQDETLFGAQVLYESRFSEKYTNEREIFERQECVSSSFSESLQVGVPMFEVQQNFETSSDSCTSSASNKETLASLGISSVRISSVGMPPVLDNSIWYDSASAHPVPVKYRLEKISTLFLTDWFQSVFETDQSNQSSVDAINGTAMYEFFEELSEEYCGIMGLSCEVISKGCGYNSNCTLGEKCIPDEGLLGYSCQKGCGITDDCSVYEKCFNDTSLYGYNCKKGCKYTANCPEKTTCVDDSSARGYSCLKSCEISSTCPSGHKCYEESNSLQKFMCVKDNFETSLIAGGKTKDSRSNGKYPGLSEVTESVTKTKTYSDLYRGVYLNAVVYSRGRLFMCGGRQKDWKGSVYHTTDCYRFSGSRSSPFSARSRIADLPTTAYFISAASIGDASVWFIVSNRLHKLDTYYERFSTVNLPFNAYGVHCTVTNGTHAYIIGAGSGKNEIWVNKYANNEKYWRRAGYLSRGREWHGCLWYGTNIMITGGSHLRSDVEMFNTETHIRWTGVPLPWGRHGHRMMIYDGRPTVVGGRGSSGFLRDMMRFDLSTKKWSTYSRKLTESKEGFALLQY